MTGLSRHDTCGRLSPFTHHTHTCLLAHFTHHTHIHRLSPYHAPHAYVYMTDLPVYLVTILAVNTDQITKMPQQYVWLLKNSVRELLRLHNQPLVAIGITNAKPLAPPIISDLTSRLNALRF